MRTHPALFLLAFFLPTALLTAIAGSARAADGVLEISQACAVHTGCFAGDAPGFPVTITASGSYVLTSDLDIGAGAVNAIQVGAPDVTLDLGSFQVFGDDEPGVAGIDASTDRVAVRNGTVRDFSPGILLEDGSSVEHVKVFAFVLDSPAIGVGAMGLVADCVLDEDGGAETAIAAGAGSLVLDNYTYSGSSITASGSIVGGNSTASNDDLFIADDRSLILGNRASGDSLMLSADTSYRGNRIFGEPQGYFVSGGVDAGDNLCLDQFFPPIWIPCP